MKNAILGAALCGAALALAGAAHADVDSDFLSGSTNALILGATGIPTPDAAYISAAESLYLEPNGYDGTIASTAALTTPESYAFGHSVTQGENDLISAVVADYNAGDMGCDAAGVCSDPLTIFAYSQSSAVAALAEKTLSADGIPTDALRFVLDGANSKGVPDNLFPTDVYNIHGDAWAEPGSLGAGWHNLVYGLLLHESYLGLTPAEIASAIPTVDGLTTIHEIPTLATNALVEALLSAHGV
jgi:PE-PPE domain